MLAERLRQLQDAGLVPASTLLAKTPQPIHEAQSLAEWLSPAAVHEWFLDMPGNIADWFPPLATQIAAVPTEDPVTVPPISALPSPAPKTEPIVKTSSAKAGIESMPTAAQTIDLNLRDSLPLKDFVDIVASQLGLNLIYDEAALNAPVSIKLSGPIPVDALTKLDQIKENPVQFG